MDDRSEAKLRGMVQTLSCEHVFRESRMVRGENYLPDGRLSKTWYRNADGTEGHTTYSYNPAGQLIQLAFWHDGVANGTSEYHYDAQARRSRIMGLMANGTETITETFSYDAQGHKTSTRYIPDWSFTTPYGTTVGIDIGDGGVTFMAADAATVTTIYDKQGRAQQSTAHDREHQPVAIVNRKYDEQGRLQEVSTTLIKRGNKQLTAALASTSGEERVALEKALDHLFPQGQPMNRTTFGYDEQGRVIERSSWFSQLQSDRVLTTYNEQGDELTVTTYREERELNLTEEGDFLLTQPDRPSSAPTESRFAFLYDQHGNWTSRRLISNGQFQDVDTRELTYW